MKSEAYTLREWFVYIANRGIDIFDVNDVVLEEWRTDQGWLASSDRKRRTRSERVAHKKRIQIERKVHRVFEFYLYYPHALPFDSSGLRTQALVGDNSKGANFPIGCKVGIHRRRKREYLLWDRAEYQRPIVRSPKVPSEVDVQKVLNYLRGRGFREQQQTRQPMPSDTARILGDRNWTIARTMIGGGLRCEEVSDLTVDAFSIALQEAGITKTAVDLDAVSNDANEKRRIIARLLSLRDGAEYAHIDVFVTGKNSKSRYAPFELSAFVDILDVAIWGCRRELTTGLLGGAPANVFLSHKTLEKLEAKSIGDIIGDAFRKTNIKGSAHKLRSFFATVTAAHLWREYFSHNQYRFDEMLVNNTLQRLATAMGHSSVNTTLKFYMSESLFRHLTRIATPAAQLFREMWDMFVMENKSVSPKKAKIMLDLSAMISTSGDDSQLMAVLEHITHDQRFKPNASTNLPRPTLVRTPGS